jgi:hypothetical protein
MGFKSRKNKSKKVYKKNKGYKSKKRLIKITRKRKTLKGGTKEIINLALYLKNLRFEQNKTNFKQNKKRNAIGIKRDNALPINVLEQDIDIIGPDYDPVQDYMVSPDDISLLQRIIYWKNQNPGQIPPWQEYIGKLCEVPQDFFVEDANLPDNLYNVKQYACNPNFPTNTNIIPIRFDILGPANGEGKALIVPGKYKFVILSNNEVRYIPDTGNGNPHYYFPAVMLYFYNIGWISFDTLKDSLGNEIPHSFLFDARSENILGAGDFTVNDNYITNLTGYSGHTKPLPSNVIYSASIFINMGYPLIKKSSEPIRLQTENTERGDFDNRLIGTYLKIEYTRP